jgi:hypothetical protein
MCPKARSMRGIKASMGKVARALVTVSLYGKRPAPGRLFAWPGVPISPGRALYRNHLERPEPPLGELLRTPFGRSSVELRSGDLARRETLLQRVVLLGSYVRGAMYLRHST